MSLPELSASAGVSELLLCKNRLQEYAQKASMALPIYQTYTEGAPHAPHFKSQVWVDGVCFRSPNAFLNKKMAEQDAAKHALIGILEKVKNEGPSRLLEETVFCKSMVNEYAVKMNMNPPTYATNVTEAFIPMFVSLLELSGVTYTGEAGKNKKEAEQFAARAAILSILDSESSTTMSKIVKSKFKFYDALKKVKDSPNGVQGSTTISTEVKPAEDFKLSYTVQGCNVAGAMNPSQDSGPLLSVNNKNEVHVDGNTVSGPSAVIPHSSLLVPFDAFPAIQQNVLPESRPFDAFPAIQQNVLPESRPFDAFPAIQQNVLPESRSTIERPSITHVQTEPVHVFKKPKLQNTPSTIAPPIEVVPPASSAAIVPCIEFVPPVSEQVPTCSTSGKKQNRRRKKGKKGQNQSPLVAAIIPQGQSSTPAYRVVQ